MYSLSYLGSLGMAFKDIVHNLGQGIWHHSHESARSNCNASGTLTNISAPHDKEQG